MPQISSSHIRLAAAALVIAALAAYHGTFQAPFVFDDIPSIVENPSIRSLWPLSSVLSPATQGGATVSGRPLVNLTLALNHAISGDKVWSYHALNLLIHVLAGLTLFGLARRTLGLPGLREKFGALALPTALVVALVWTLHPLQTESVTYVVQRAESLMGLLYLLTFYCFVRSLDAPKPRRWILACFASCLLGMTCKEVMVTAPVLLLLYDRSFVSGSFLAALKARWRLHLALCATWIPLLALVLGTGGDRGGTFEFTFEACWTYWLTQAEALCRYLWLSFWPSPLIFEYGLIQEQSLVQVLPFLVPVALLAGLTLWALLRRPMLGFFGAGFFLILAPTSLMPGVMQMIVEHRMYLPLACVLAPLVAFASLRFGKQGLVVMLALALCAGALTVRRNHDYRSDLALWGDTVAKRPMSGPAHGNLANVYNLMGRWNDAVRHFEIAIAITPSSFLSRYNLGMMLMKLGRLDEARAQFEESLRLEAAQPATLAMLASTLVKQGNLNAAIAPATEALRLKPDLHEGHLAMGLVQAGQNRIPEAIASFERALQLQPGFGEAEMNLSLALLRLGRVEDARKHLEHAKGMGGDPIGIHFNLGIALSAAGQPEAALEQYKKAIALAPDHAEAHLNLGVLLAQQGRLEEGLAHLEKATRISPRAPKAQLNHGIALEQSQRLTEAIACYEEAIRLQPDYAIAHYNLGNALLRQDRLSDARAHFAEALRLSPSFTPARQMLEQLSNVP